MSWQPPRSSATVRLVSNPYSSLLFFGRELMIRLRPEAISGRYAHEGWMVKFAAEEIQDPGLAMDTPLDYRLRLEHEALQELANQLWECGYRPEAAAGSAGQLAAVERHLKDVIEVRDKTLGIVMSASVLQTKS